MEKYYSLDDLIYIYNISTSSNTDERKYLINQIIKREPNLEKILKNI